MSWHYCSWFRSVWQNLWTTLVSLPTMSRISTWKTRPPHRGEDKESFTSWPLRKLGPIVYFSNVPHLSTWLKSSLIGFLLFPTTSACFHLRKIKLRLVVVLVVQTGFIILEVFWFYWPLVNSRWTGRRANTRRGRHSANGSGMGTEPGTTALRTVASVCGGVF